MEKERSEGSTVIVSVFADGRMGIGGRIAGLKKLVRKYNGGKLPLTEVIRQEVRGSERPGQN